MFPVLTAAQLAPVAAHGTERRLSPGEVLVEVGDTHVPFFVVTAGELEAVRLFGAAVGEGSIAVALVHQVLHE